MSQTVPVFSRHSVFDSAPLSSFPLSTADVIPTVLGVHSRSVSAL